ncbi:apolipoprotein A-I [Protobothrops mucrosquamatus]|uniref:apolipoprotein A-I n=1 Tax=Protobothrops mucrosquamatus TaxID=103944 RepID=UPI000775B4C8|nr:apolipoprotein A-I [Protobothrops mucrosquamatus]
MQSLNLVLALLLLTGAQARYFWQHDDPQQTRLEHLQELGQVYLESAKTAVQQAVVQFDSSAVAQELQVNLGQKLEALTIVLREIKEQITPELQEVRIELETAWQKLKEEVTRDVQDLGAQIQPLLRRLRENVQQDAAAYFQQLSSVSKEINQAAQERLRPVAEGFRDKVRTHVDEFRKDAAPYAKKLEQLIQEKVKTLEQSAQAEFTELQTELQQQLSEVREKYGPLWETAREELLTMLENVKSLFVATQNLEQETQQQSS